MTLGECINNYLNDHNISMRKFASLAGISHAYISYIVNGKTTRGNAPAPTLQIYKSIASAMGISTNELIDMVDDKIAWGDKNTVTDGDGLVLSDKDLKFIEWFRSLPQEKQKAILISQDAPEDLF